MARLKSKTNQIPNGLRFKQAETKWEPPRYSSFDTIVRLLIDHRRGNLWLAQQRGWAMDYASVSEEVEQFNVKICQDHGWHSYIDGGGSSAPKLQPAAAMERAGQLAAGGGTLVSWIASGAEAVPQAQAEHRASVCAACPQNKPGDLLDFFTSRATEAIRYALNQRDQWKLETTHDEKLSVCQVCHCPLKLKIFMDISSVRSKMPDDEFNQLPQHCWIVKESEARSPDGGKA